MKITRRQLREMIQESGEAVAPREGETVYGDGDTPSNNPHTGRPRDSIMQKMGSSQSHSDMLEYIFSEILTIRQQKQVSNKMIKDMESAGLPSQGVAFMRGLLKSAIKAQRKEKWREFFRLGKD